MTATKNITIIDYGMGNIWSVISALRHLGHEPAVSDRADDIAAADFLILPGVGAFALAMKALREKGLDEAITKAVTGSDKRILGICLGMQLLCRSSTEGGDTAGLALIPGDVSRFDRRENLKVPHVGFNLVHAPSGTALFAGLPEAADFYFVHSYRMLADTSTEGIAVCNHGGDFAAAYEHGNIFATQFHPEKSQTNGLAVLQNFLK